MRSRVPSVASGGLAGAPRPQVFRCLDIRHLSRRHARNSNEPRPYLLIRYYPRTHLVPFETFKQGFRGFESRPWRNRNAVSLRALAEYPECASRRDGWKGADPCSASRSNCGDPLLQEPRRAQVRAGVASACASRESIADARESSPRT